MELLAGWLLLLLALFVVIVPHEAAHALFMIRYGIRINRIFIGIPGIIKIRKSNPPITAGPILVIGGVSPNEQDMKLARPRHEIILTLAGPFTSILFGLALMIITSLISNALGIKLLFSANQCQSDPLNSLAWDTWRSFQNAGILGFVWWTGILSLIVGIMNLLPIPPLDGGRVFFLILEKFFPVWGKRIGQIVLIAGVILILFYNFWVIGESVVNVGTGIANNTSIC